MANVELCPAIRSSYDVRKAITQLSFHPETRLAALGCMADVKIVRVDRSVTDVAWGMDERQLLAVTFNTGELRCVALNSAGALETTWATTSENALNRVSWHPSDLSLVATADSKGFLRIQDTRAPTQTGAISCRFMHNQSKNTRDIQFNAFQPDLFAAVADNHFSVRIWDRRNLKSHVMETIGKDSAHRLGVTSLAWSPTQSHVFATGSMDKTVKVWDTSSCSLGPGISAHEPLLTHTINTNAEVTRVQWGKDYRDSPFLTTLSQNAGNVSTGNVYLWKLNEPHNLNVPVCVLSGHDRDPCTSFQWVVLDDPSAGSASAAPMLLSRKMEGRSKKSRSRDSNKPAPEPIPAFLLSAGKDGRLMLQDPRKGVRPFDKISASVTGISSQGHVAYHCSPRAAPDLLFQPPGAGSGKNSGRSTPTTVPPSPPPNPPPALPVGAMVVGQAAFYSLDHIHAVRMLRNNAEASVFDPAVIYVLATRYAMPHFFSDPTATEARAQSADWLGAPSAQTELREEEATYVAALTACRANEATAEQAGLQCRAAVWAAMRALIPLPGDAGPGRELPFAAEVLSQLLKDLLEAGDSQHFVSICETLRHLRVSAPPSNALSLVAQESSLLEQVYSLANLPTQAIRRVYLSYLDLLMHLQLHCKATEIIKSLSDVSLVVSLQKDIDFAIKCSKCRKEIAKRDATAKYSPAWCVTCRRCASLCSFCHEACTGLMQWCPVCTHGGHLECMVRWFRLYNTCPTGCGHGCCSTPPLDGLCVSSAVGYERSFPEQRRAERQRRKGQRGRQLANLILQRTQATHQFLAQQTPCV